MKQLTNTIVTALVLTLALIISSGTALAAPPVQDCVTIQNGTLMTSEPAPIDTGFDKWGYNYQARSFNGKYCDSYRDASWCQPYKDVDLMQKWNEAWLDNKDCDGDGLLDRHYGFASYVGSGAWLTNHQRDQYVDLNGKKQRWEYFVKIVAVPSDAVADDGVWKQDGVVIGPVIWGEFAILMEVYNDTGSADHGVAKKSELRNGLGSYKPNP